ncbi:YciI family protein [Paenibacillus cremeus]|uniref:YCII-related domain-containing protein n=1 Tax=Paenibacillus cremeus TaxID=2163881 RepID=A0A559KFB6_9BACL|nr:YciI family protein [Paenibacillus cremeus]TVY10824.1 hypothetical protein FPZ49_06930 [Paenibacillus cremeus]
MEQLRFLATARPKTDHWLQNMTDEEKAVMGQHFAYANQTFAEGKIVFAGACLDGAMGIIVYEAATEAEAYELYSNDPLVKSGIVHTEFHPFRVGLMR